MVAWGERSFCADIGRLRGTLMIEDDDLIDAGGDETHESGPRPEE
jgi:hypothetical protein